MPFGRVLVIEGGGMKAAYANGVLSAFEAAAFSPWDAIVGTSAGGALAAWYAAGQARFAEGTWAYARDPSILSYRRFLTRRGPLLDHERLLDHVYVTAHPLDEAAIHRSPVPVFVTASRVRDGGCTYHDLRDGPVIPWLKATGRLPLASGDPVAIDGEAYLDGGIADPIPVRHAVETLGARHVTLVANSPSAPPKADPGWLTNLTARRYPALALGIQQHHARKAAAMAYAEAPPPGVRIDIIRPITRTGLSRLSRDEAKLAAAIDQGRADGEAYARTRSTAGELAA